MVFNTALSGYQEIVTDPSYAGQVITFTYPHIGNYGVNADDDESRRPFCSGVVVRDLARAPPATGAPQRALDDLLVAPRRARHHRDRHPPPHPSPPRRGRAARRVRHRRSSGARRSGGARAAPTASTSSPPSPPTEPYVAGSDDAPFRVVAYDFGIKRTILRHLVGVGLSRRGGARDARPRPTSSPASPTASSSRTVPATLLRSSARRSSVRGLVGEVPVFGICLGHQILGLALGGDTYKLRFGHHGGNHPVRHEATGRVEITSQNHNYAVDADSLGRASSSSRT